MLAFAGTYRTDCLYPNNCRNGLESFLYLKLYNTMIVIDFRVRYCPCWHLLVNMGLVVYILNCVQGLESFLYLKIYNTMILVNAALANKYSTFKVRYCPCWNLLVIKGLMI